MVRKEIHCHMIGYNLVRAAIVATALRFALCPSQLSFTGAMQAVEEFAASLRLGTMSLEFAFCQINLASLQSSTIDHLRIVGSRLPN